MKNYVAGIMTIADWFGEGMNPVEPTEANRRALVCASCPLNKFKPAEEHFSGFAHTVIGIRRWLKERGCRTDLDWKLHVCEACSCPMRVKIWVPLEVLLRRMNPESKAKLHSGCWMK